MAAPRSLKHRPLKYRVVNPNPRNTGTRDHPRFGPSGVREGTGERVYTKRDVLDYERATGQIRSQSKRKISARGARDTSKRTSKRSSR